MKGQFIEVKPVPQEVHDMISEEAKMVAAFLNGINKMAMEQFIKEEKEYRKENWERSTPWDHYRNYGAEVF